MYCTSCGSNLGTWTKKSCPRCGAPLRASGTDTQSTTLGGLDSTLPPASTTSPASTPAKKRTGLLWLIIGLVAFVVVVVAVWFIFDMNNPPFTENQPDKETKGLRKTPPPDIPAPPPDPIPDPTPDTIPLPPDPIPDPTPPDPIPDPTPLDPIPDPTPLDPIPDPPPQDPVPDLPPVTTSRPPSATIKTMSPSKRSALRAELSQCEDYRCTKRVQQRYCEGFWNRVAECKSAL